MNNRYIIIADDDADDLELITSYFKQYNPEVDVLSFKDGREVLMFLESFALSSNLPLLIVLDVNMPVSNGRETLISLRDHQQYRRIPVVMYTSSPGSDEEEFCNQYGASWVTKPSSVDAIRQTARVLAKFCYLQTH